MAEGSLPTMSPCELVTSGCLGDRHAQNSSSRSQTFWDLTFLFMRELNLWNHDIILVTVSARRWKCGGESLKRARMAWSSLIMVGRHRHHHVRSSRDRNLETSAFYFFACMEQRSGESRRLETWNTGAVEIRHRNPQGASHDISQPTDKCVEHEHLLAKGPPQTGTREVGANNWQCPTARIIPKDGTTVQGLLCESVRSSIPHVRCKRNANMNDM